jgi:ATP/ADP translocase
MMSFHLWHSCAYIIVPRACFLSILTSYNMQQEREEQKTFFIIVIMIIFCFFLLACLLLLSFARVLAPQRSCLLLLLLIGDCMEGLLKGSLQSNRTPKTPQFYLARLWPLAQISRASKERGLQAVSNRLHTQKILVSS